MNELEKKVNWHVLQGLAKAKAGDFAAAVDEFSRAIELAPDFAPLYYNRGRAYEDWGKPAAALGDYDRAIERNPEYDQALNNRAGLRMRQGDTAGAIADWSAIVQRKPDFFEAFYNRGVAYAAQGRAGEALADLTRVIQLNPKMAAAYVQRAKVGQAVRPVKDTLADFDRALQLNAKDGLVFHARGLAFCSQRTREGVRRCIEDMGWALRYAPPDFHYQIYQDRGVAYSLLVTEFGEQDAFEQAEADLGESIRKGSLFAYFVRAKLYEAVGQADKATADLKAFLAKGGGQAYGNLPQVQAALRQLEQ
ncbi:MAG: tetratricopeptide repeat protein [Anaerolineae bacterium]|nr:tetratricopeptide repeat protein [Anaerolineae bacterium]